MSVKLTVTEPGKLDIEEISSFLAPIEDNLMRSAPACGILNTCKVSSALQPILSLTHQKTVGYEALARAWHLDGNALSPFTLFNMPQTAKEHVLLDRLCRYLHILNFIKSKDKTNWLFLNISPDAVSRGGDFDSFFGDLLQQLHFPAHRIVVEIVEHSSSDNEALSQAVNYYKSLGCLTAIDDFGAGHSNFERIWSLSPDIVKLDRSMIVRASEQKRARSLLNGIVSLLHQAGCMVLMEGVETREQGLIALDSGVDFVQGFYFAKPGELQSEGACRQKLCDLGRENKKRFYLRKNPISQIQQSFSPVFTSCINDLMQGEALHKSSLTLLNHPAIEQVYIIDEQGNLIDNISTTCNNRAPQDKKYTPLADTRHVDWFRRDYLRRAINNPGVLQVSRPYLSISGGTTCVTLSQMYFGNDQRLVLCADLSNPKALGE